MTADSPSGAAAGSTATPGLYVLMPPPAGFEKALAQLARIAEAAEIACILADTHGLDAIAASRMIEQLSQCARKVDAALLVQDLDLATDAETAGLVDGLHAGARYLANSGPEGPGAAETDPNSAALDKAVVTLKPDRIVGAGLLKTRHAAMSAGENDIDYVMFGEPDANGWAPPFETTLERTAWWSEIFTVPCVACAGSVSEAAQLAAAGADFIAAGEMLWNGSSDPAETAAALAATLGATVAAG